MARLAPLVHPGPMDLRALAGVDLNLLVHLRALLVERHVTRAAEQVGVGQPAMSRSLARARELFGDRLLVRSGGEYRPTPRAQELLPRVEETLRMAGDLLRPSAFEPATARGKIRLAMPDAVAFVLASSVLRRVASLAPGLDVEISQWHPQWKDLLERGALDLAVGFPSGSEGNLRMRLLFESEWAVLLRRGHPALRRRWTPELYASLDHVVVSLVGPSGASVDDALAAVGLQRRVALRVQSPLLAPFLVAESDLALTVARWVALRLQRQVGVVLRRPPIPLPGVRVPLVWHARLDHDPQQRWFREQIAACASSLDPRKL